MVMGNQEILPSVLPEVPQEASQQIQKLCRLRIATDVGTYIKVRDAPVITNSSETRRKWVAGMQAVVAGSRNEDDMKIRSLDFVLGLDGSVHLADGKEVGPALADDGCGVCHMVYPSRFQIPPATIEGLDAKEQVRRAELFALGSLIYEIHKGETPFEELDDAEVQCRYAKAEFPPVAELEQWPIILTCWSVEFACELSRIWSKLHFPPPIPDGKNLTPQKAEKSTPSKLHNALHTTTNFIQSHPHILATLKITGLFITATSLAAPLIFGAIGFSALGPIAGSSAAAWQASMGAVEAGSLFAWCQSAAMGGAAVNGIIAAGATGAGVAGSAAAAGAWGDMAVTDIPNLREVFERVCRRAG